MVVNYGDVMRAQVKVSNVDDATRKFDINANAWVNSEKFETLEQGQVFEGDVELAVFYYYSENNMSVNFHCDVERQSEILAVVNEFIAACNAMPGLKSL